MVLHRPIECTALIGQVPLSLIPHPSGDLLDVHQRHVRDGSLNPAVVRPVHSAPLGSLFLIDVLFLAEATDRAAEPDADIESHRPASRPSPADAYTLDESRSRRRIPRNV